MKNSALLFIALLIAAQHLFFLVYFSPMIEPDSAGYIALGQTLASNLVFDSAVRLPGYPAFLAVFYHLFGESQLPVVIFQHILGMIVYLAFLSLLDDRRSKIIFSVFFLCDLLYASYQHAIVSETLFSFLLCISAIEFRNYTKTGKLPHLLICGALVAAGIFTKPVLKFFPAIVLVLLIAERKPLMKKASAAAVFLLVPLLAVNLWSWRNYTRHDSFSLLPLESFHYVGRVVQYIEFPKNSISRETFRKYLGSGPVPSKSKARAAILYAVTADLEAKGITETELGSEFSKVYKLSVLRHPFWFLRQTAVEMFTFFFSAHNLYARTAFAGKLPYSVTEAFETGNISGLAVKVAVSMHPFYWLLFLLTAYFSATRWRELLAGGDGFAAYGLALILYISGVTSVANEGLANYRCPIQPFMLFCSALAISDWLRLRTLASRRPQP